MEYKTTKISYMWNVTEKKIEDEFHKIFLKIDQEVEYNTYGLGQRDAIPFVLPFPECRRKVSWLSSKLFPLLDTLREQLLYVVSKDPEWSMRLDLESVGYEKILEYCESSFKELHLIYLWNMDSNTLEISPETERVVYGAYF